MLLLLFVKWPDLLIGRKPNRFGCVSQLDWRCISLLSFWCCVRCVLQVELSHLGRTWHQIAPPVEAGSRMESGSLQNLLRTNRGRSKSSSCNKHKHRMLFLLRFIQISSCFTFDQVMFLVMFVKWQDMSKKVDKFKWNLVVQPCSREERISFWCAVRISYKII